MSTRTVKHIEKALPNNMGGMIVYQPLPSAALEQVDPVLLIHHARVKFSGHRDPLQAGVGPHPHRGFSPVTFIFKGGVHHRDSLGNSSVIYEGGTQWIHSGQGILHSERPPKDIAEKGGIQEIIQIWINVPAKNKMDAPSYQPLTLEETPAIATGDEKVKIWLVAGNYEGTQGPVKTLSPLLVMRMQFEKGGRYSFKVPSSFNALIYLLEGKLSFGDEIITTKHMVVFHNDGDTIDIEAKEDSTFVLLSGEPINEPVAARGPFVMNTQAEISAAIRDYQAGKFGELVE